MLRFREDEEWELLVRFVAGECDERERAAVLAAISVDDARGELLEQLQEIWDAAQRTGEPVDVRSAWERLDARVREQAGPVRPLASFAAPAARHALRRSRFRTGQRMQWLVLAVSVLVLTVLAGRYVFPQATFLPADGPEASFKEFATEKGHQATIRLVDGTVVRLNASSSLRVPRHFADDVRTVELVGEAHFRVASDSTRPFRVRTPRATVEVLGTTFNVRAYRGEEEVKVAVAEGRVALLSGDAARPDTVILSAHDVGIVLAGRSRRVERDAPVTAHLDWTEGRLTFENAPFEEVATRLERWYDLEVELEGAAPTADGLTASFGNESLDLVLRSISIALSLDYRIEDEKVTFFAARPVN